MKFHLSKPIPISQLSFSDIQGEPKACQSRPDCENALRVSIGNTEIFGSMRSKEFNLG